MADEALGFLKDGHHVLLAGAPGTGKTTVAQWVAHAWNARADRVPAEAFGFRLARVSGSHHIYAHPEIPELINLQEIHGQAKAYQIRQLLQLVERHNLEIGDAE